MKFRSIFIVLAAVCCTVLFPSCVKEDRSEAQYVLIYLAGNNSLSYYAQDNVDQLAMGFLPPDGDPNRAVFVYLHTYNAAPELRKYSLTKEGNMRISVVVRYDENTNSADPATLTRVANDVQMLWPAKNRGLILWSHATGYLPEGYFNDPKELAGRRIMDMEDPYRNLVKSSEDSLTRTFGNDYNGDKEMEIAEVSAALPFHYDYIIFDACLMGGIEVAYEMKDNCDYIVFSPTEILAQGFPYYMMMDALFNRDVKDGLIATAEEYYRYYYERSQVERTKGCTVSVIQTDQLEGLAKVAASIFDRHRNEIFALNGSYIQQYFRLNRHWFYDLRDIVSKVADADEYSKFCTALDRAVIYRAATERFLSIIIDPKKYSGLSSYLPNPEYEYLNEFYKTLAWNKATGLVK